MPRIAETITVGEDGFGFPTSELLTGRGFITGKSGAGKSNSSTVIAEELLELGLPFVIVDIDGEYWGLKEAYDIHRVGRDEGVDEPFTLDNVEFLVDLLLEDTTPLILDLSGIPDADEVDDLLWAFIHHCFERENEVRKPCLLFVEELHEFLPQTGGHDDLAELLVRVAKRGRKRGLGICGLSQRPAAVDKEFITQCDWIVWHRLTWENDVSVVEGILGAEAAEQVQELGTGEGLVMTDWDEEVTRVPFRRKRTFDAGATPDLSSFTDEELAPRRRPPSDADDAATSTPGDGGSGAATRGVDSGNAATSGRSSSERSPATADGGGGTGSGAATVGDPDGEFDPIQELALLVAYAVGGLSTVVIGGVRAARSLPAMTRRATPAALPLSGELTGDRLDRRDRWLTVAVALLVLVGVGLLAAAVVLWLGAVG